MKTIILAITLLFPCLAAVAQDSENLTPIQWNNGRLYIEEGEHGVDNAVVRFDDGKVLVLENLLVEERKTVTDVVTKRTRTDLLLTILPMDTKDPKLTKSTLFKASPMPKMIDTFSFPKALGKGPIAGVVLAYDSETQNLFWLLEPYGHIRFKGKSTSGRKELLIAGSRLTPIGNSGDRLVFRLNSEIDRFEDVNLPGSITQVTASYDRLFMYDALEHTLRTVSIHAAYRGLGASGPRKYLLPVDAKAQIFVDRSGRLKAKVDEQFFFLDIYETREAQNSQKKQLSSQSESSPTPDNDGEVVGEEAWVDDYADSRAKNAEDLSRKRLFWTFGLNSTVNFLDQQLANSERRLARVDEISANWLQALSIGSVYDGGKTAAFNDLSRLKENVLLLEMSSDVSTRFPNVRYEIAKDVVKAFEARTNPSLPSDVFYLRVSEASRLDPSFFAMINKHVEMQGGLTGALPRKTLLLIDLLDHDPFAGDNEVQNLIDRNIFLTRYSGVENPLRSPHNRLHVALLWRASKKSTFHQYFENKDKSVNFRYNIDSLLKESDFLSAVESGLSRKGFHIERDVLTALFHAIRSENPEWSKNFVSTTDFIDDILYIAKNSNLDPSSSNIAVEIAHVYNQINGVRSLKFDRNTHDRINKLYDTISANGAHPISKPLLLLDPQIREVEKILKEKRSQSKLPFAALLFLGPPGTGKTIFANAVADALGTIKKETNAGTIPKKGDEGLDLTVVQEKVKEAHLQSGFKTYILEEIDKQPALYPYLTAALDPEQTAEKDIETKGMLWLLTANMRKEAPELKELLAMKPSEFTSDAQWERYHALKYKVAVAALAGNNDEQNQKIRSLIDRLHKGIIFVPSIENLTEKERNEVMQYLSRQFELEQNVRVLMREPAKAFLNRTLDANKHGNLRTGMAAVSDAMRLAVTSYKEEHPGIDVLSGYFVMNPEKNLDGQNALQLKSLDSGNAAVVASLVGDYVDAFNKVVLEAAEDATQVFKDELRRMGNADVGVELLYAKMRRFAEAYRIVSRVSLTGSQNPRQTLRWVDRLPFPDSVRRMSKQKERLRASFDSFAPLYASIAPEQIGPPRAAKMSTSEVVSLISRVVALLDKLQQSEVEGERFLNWANEVLRRFREVSKEALQVDVKREISATSILAALLINDMARSYSQERLDAWLPKDAGNNLAKPEVIAQASKPKAELPPRAESCKELLEAISAETKKAKDLF